MTDTKPPVRRRLWIESSAAALFLLATILAVVNPAWLEAVLPVEPDGGSGSTEWGLVLVTGMFALGLSLAAAREWRRGAAAQTP